MKIKITVPKSPLYLKSLSVALKFPQFLDNPTKLPFGELPPSFLELIKHSGRTQFRLLHQRYFLEYRVPFDHGSPLVVDSSITVDLRNGAFDGELLKPWGFDKGEMGYFEWKVPRVRKARRERNMAGMQR